MKYKAKSAIIARKKRDPENEDIRPCFISLFDVNNPHKTAEAPRKIVDFKTDKFVIEGLDILYLPVGNDIVINDLSELDVEVIKGNVHVKGKQSKDI